MLVDRLQAGDQDVVRALRAFDVDIASAIMDEYPPNRRHKLPPKPEVLVTGNEAMKAKMTALAVAAAFVEVWLAKEGHSGPIGINLLEKVQTMHLPILLGAMLAGVDYVLVGAGIPHQVPAVLASYARNEPASYRMDVAGSSEKYLLTLDPGPFVAAGARLRRPRFLLIASHHALAMRLSATVEVDGFVMEGPSAGGHNAPAAGRRWPRMDNQSTASGTGRTWRSSRSWGNRFGSPGPTQVRSGSVRPGPRGLPASR